MSVIFEISFPVFAIILCGYLAGITGILGKKSAVALNGFVYYFSLPALLFAFTAQAPVLVILNWSFIGSVLSASLAAYLLALAVSVGVFKHRLTVSGLSALTGVFSNTGYLGIPLFLAAFGPENAGPAIVATVTVNIIFVGGTIALLELAGRRGKSPLYTVLNVMKSLAKNPLVSAPVVALPVAFLEIKLSIPVSRFLELLGSAAAPAALFAIGISFVERTIKARKSEIGAFVLIKMVVHPFFAWVAVNYLFDMETFWASSAILLSALPTAAVAFVMAQERGIYVSEVSSVIVVSTITSVATVSALLVYLPF